MAFLVLCTMFTSNQASFEPPLYNITASSLYEAGVQHGRLAKNRIQAWFNSDEMTTLKEFVRSEGKDAYQQLRHDSASAFPGYADELRGIAAGANVSLEDVWTNILMVELENLNNKTKDHCSDISAISNSGYRDGFAHGHNEDWSPDAGKNYYYIKYTAAPGANFASCAGLAYPGSLIGWAPTWNAYGVFFAVNTLVPKSIKSSGISTSFIQRDAICGMGKGKNLKSVVTGLIRHGWADGASINVVDTRGGAMANVEVYEDRHSVQLTTESMGNSSHFNAYKRISVSQAPEGSSVIRQHRADSLAPPRSFADVARILSNTDDGPGNSILRNITIATLLLDGLTGRLEVFGGLAPATTKPVHTWNIHSFFD